VSYHKALSSNFYPTGFTVSLLSDVDVVAVVVVMIIMVSLRLKLRNVRNDVTTKTRRNTKASAKS